MANDGFPSSVPEWWTKVRSFGASASQRERLRQRMTPMAWKATIHSAPAPIASGRSTTSVITAFQRVIRDGSVTTSKTMSAGAKMTALAEPRRVVTLTMLAGAVDVGKGLVHHSGQPGRVQRGSVSSSPDLADSGWSIARQGTASTGGGPRRKPVGVTSTVALPDGGAGFAELSPAPSRPLSRNTRKAERRAARQTPCRKCRAPHRVLLRVALVPSRAVRPRFPARYSRSPSAETPVGRWGDPRALLAEDRARTRNVPTKCCARPTYRKRTVLTTSSTIFFLTS